jgi:hypothetical protein
MFEKELWMKKAITRRKIVERDEQGKLRPTALWDAKVNNPIITKVGEWVL